MSAPTVDFKQVKDAATVESVIRFLNLTLKKEGDGWRGKCHLCKATDPRAFAITTSKRLFHCFKCQKGGDMLKLVADTNGMTTREAALALAAFLGLQPAPAPSAKHASATGSATAPPSPERKGFDAEKYAAGLDPEHASLEPLGISADTYRNWKAGFSSSGVNRGRLALPICTRDGTVIGYCGRAITGEQQPALIFPNGLVPSEHIFGADRAGAGELVLVRDPLDVLKAAEDGIENVVCFFTEGISSAQLQYLSALMDEKHIESLTLF
jgi:DNA primase